MKVIELMIQVSFEEIKKELLLTDINFRHTLNKFEVYFAELTSMEFTIEPQDNMVKLKRDCFDVSYLTSEEGKNTIDQICTFIPVETILSSTISPEDLKDFSKGLIVAGILNLLTFYGVSFSEEERLQEIERTKEDLRELNLLIKSIDD